MNEAAHRDWHLCIAIIVGRDCAPSLQLTQGIPAHGSNGLVRQDNTLSCDLHAC
jgi:hypothetical protein